MYTLELPPFVEVAVAATPEEIESLQRQYAFVKLPQAGTPRRNVDDVLQRWSQQVALANMWKQPQPLRRLDDVGPLSALTITLAVEAIVENFDGETNQDDIFYLVYPQAVSRLVAGVRNILQVADSPETKVEEINGVLFRQKKPFTYWLPSADLSVLNDIKIAFYQSDLFSAEDGPTGWRLLKHSPTQPILTWYVSTNEPALHGEATLAVADTAEVEERSFAVLQEAIKRSRTPISNVISHPNGMQEFPDYKAVIGDQLWSIEITRPLGQMAQGRVIALGNEGTSLHIRNAAFQPGLAPDTIQNGLRKATEDKSQRRTHLAHNEKYCLLLVDTIGTVDPGDPMQWEYCDLDAFDSVILLQLIPDRPNRIATIKGGLRPEPELFG